MSERKKRIRRTPEEARRVILDAAEKTMGKNGPAGLRLQDIAREAGVSHPTILHHFGSREGLVQALNVRAMDKLTRGVIEGMDSGQDGIARTFETYRNGVAERLVWLLQSGVTPPEERLKLFDDVVDSLHAVRRKFASPGNEPDIADTRHIAHLTTVAALGDALFGQRLRQAGEHEEEERTAFEAFVRELIEGFLREKA
ncbi:TetR family transcriptional regulator [Altererythrobacter indicus]|uniref:TetR family transcriptional regulator n=1 Tax=Altericroceibacterium indicum TaxID=374177 RepID=A0A845A7Q2_9SPHN|nr:TetR family transcriptional regulator [Altericroceibacterium indicum]